MQELRLVQTQGLPIFEQLQLEEALLRADDGFWCLINEGSPPAVVMGISGQTDALHLESLGELPVIRRFSGGGTVVVDDNTLFVSLLGPRSILPCASFPEPIMRWTGTLYQEALRIPSFHMRENDYAIGNLKCGGNAQYLRKERWLHHTSFLWDYCPNRMNVLKMPTHKPKYRQGRDHIAFLTPLKNYLPSKKHLRVQLIQLMKRQFHVRDVSLIKAQQALTRPHRQATHYLSTQKTYSPRI